VGHPGAGFGTGFTPARRRSGGQHEGKRRAGETQSQRGAPAFPPTRLFDVAVRGIAGSAWPDPEPKNVDLAGLVEAGATWWMKVYFDLLDMSLDVVDAGPPGR
jgi:hypothetical protein